MQTILLQDEPALFRGLEQSLVRREEIRLLSAGPAELEAVCRQRQPDLVLLWGDDPDPPLARRLRAEAAGSLCMVAADPEAARQALEEARRRLGVPARDTRRSCCRLRAVLEQGRSRVEGRTRDLSVAGVFVALDPAALPGDEVRVLLRRPGARRGPEPAGRIVRRVPADAAGRRLAGVAVRFADEARLSPADLARLAAGQAQP